MRLSDPGKSRSKRRTPVVLACTQGYPPDPTTGGQHLRDIVEEIARRGFEVRVLAASRDYNDPRIRYPADEQNGVRVTRLPLSALGKASIARRMLAGIVFTLQCTMIGLAQPRLAGVVVTTAPPISPIAGWALSLLRGVPLSYWVQDLHPDQLIALGRVGERSPFARLVRLLNRLVIARARAVVPMDRFMAERLERYRPAAGVVRVRRPWAHEDRLAPLEHADNPVRRERGWEGKRVLLYSGNLGHHTPIDALLEALRRLDDRDEIILAIAGTGVRVADAERFAERHALEGVRVYPFVPYDEMGPVLAAADAHLVSMGDAVSGMIHPNKLYAAMAVARPVLVLAPSPSYADELVEPHGIGWQTPHDPERVLAALRAFATASDEELRAMGRRGRELLERSFRKASLVGATCDALLDWDTRNVERGARAGADA